MTLTEFLLARIADDEAVARRAQRHYQHVFGIPHYFTANGDTSVAMNPRVALAECEAKRAIVENAERNRKRTPLMAEHDIFAWHVRVLGWVYRDHPDYREEWRP